MAFDSGTIKDRPGPFAILMGVLLMFVATGAGALIVFWVAETVFGYSRRGIGQGVVALAFAAWALFFRWCGVNLSKRSLHAARKGTPDLENVPVDEALSDGEPTRPWNLPRRQMTALRRRDEGAGE